MTSMRLAGLILLYIGLTPLICFMYWAAGMTWMTNGYGDFEAGTLAFVWASILTIGLLLVTFAKSKSVSEEGQ